MCGQAGLPGADVWDVWRVILGAEGGCSHGAGSSGTCSPAKSCACRIRLRHKLLRLPTPHWPSCPRTRRLQAEIYTQKARMIPLSTLHTPSPPHHPTDSLPPLAPAQAKLHRAKISTTFSRSTPAPWSGPGYRPLRTTAGLLPEVATASRRPGASSMCMGASSVLEVGDGGQHPPPLRAIGTPFPPHPP